MSSPRKQNGKAGVIASVKTPLGLYALAFLIIEGILVGIAAKAQGSDFTILVVGMILCLFLMVAAVGYCIVRNPDALVPVTAREAHAVSNISVSPTPTMKHDIFLSSPMAGLPSSKEYEANRKLVLQLIDTFRRECGFENIFYAGRDIGSVDDFEPEGISVKDDLKAIEESRFFVMIYHSKVVTSSLFEAGCAVALHKPSLYFVRSEDDLPFLLKQAVQAFIDVKIYKSADIKDVIKLVCNHRLKLFGL